LKVFSKKKTKTKLTTTNFPLWCSRNAFRSQVAPKVIHTLGPKPDPDASRRAETSNRLEGVLTTQEYLPALPSSSPSGADLSVSTTTGRALVSLRAKPGFAQEPPAGDTATTLGLLHLSVARRLQELPE